MLQFESIPMMVIIMRMENGTNIAYCHSDSLLNFNIKAF